MVLAERRAGARSLATISFGVILVGFSAAPAQALTANSGTDYLLTPTGGARFVFDPPGGPKVAIPYSGLPILTPTPNGSPNGGVSGLADTVVNRINSVTGIGTTDLKIVGLSLFATNVGLPGVGTYDTVAGLQKYYGNTAGGGPTSTGIMAINTLTQKWDSAFTVKAVGFFAAPGTLGLPNDPYAGTHSPDLVRDIIQNIVTPGGTPGVVYDCESSYGGSILGKCLLFDKTFFTGYDPTNPDSFADQLTSWLASPTALTEDWSTTPIVGQLLGDNLVIEAPNTSPLPQNFFIESQVKHDAGNGTIHTVDPVRRVPGPLPILGVGAAFKASRRLRRISRQSR